MATMTTQDVLEQARERHETRNERLLTAANGSCEIGGLSVVLHELGAIWREEAKEVEEARKRSWKTTSEQLRDAATRVIAVAQGLEKYGSNLGPTHSRADVTSAPGPTSRASGPTLDADAIRDDPRTIKAEWNVAEAQRAADDVVSDFLVSLEHCGAAERISRAVCTKPKHDAKTSHHGNGITWPWDNEPEPETKHEARTLDEAGAAIIARVKEGLDADQAASINAPRAKLPLITADMAAVQAHVDEIVDAPPIVTGRPNPNWGMVDGGWHQNDEIAKQGLTSPLIAIDIDTPNGETVTSFTIGTADAPPAWAAEPKLEPIALSAPPSQPIPGHLSVSSLELLNSCPLKWRLHYLHGVPRRPGWAAIGGTALHSVIKQLEMVPSLREGLTAEAARLMFASALDAEVLKVAAESPFPVGTWNAAQSGKEDRAFWEADGPEMVHRYLEWRAKWVEQGWELLFVPGKGHIVETEVLFTLPGTAVPLKGFIDSAWIHPASGEVAVIDPKSGRSLPTDHFQLAVYAAALEDLGVRPKAGRFLGAYWSARDGATTDLVDLSARCPRDELVYRVNGAVAQISAGLNAGGVFMPNPSANYGGCGSCDARLSCPVGTRRGLGKVSSPQASPVA